MERCLYKLRAGFQELSLQRETSNLCPHCLLVPTVIHSQAPSPYTLSGLGVMPLWGTFKIKNLPRSAWALAIDVKWKLERRLDVSPQHTQARSEFRPLPGPSVFCEDQREGFVGMACRRSMYADAGLFFKTLKGHGCYYGLDFECPQKTHVLETSLRC